MAAKKKAAAPAASDDSAASANPPGGNAQALSPEGVKSPANEAGEAGAKNGESGSDDGTGGSAGEVAGSAASNGPELGDGVAQLLEGAPPANEAGEIAPVSGEQIIEGSIGVPAGDTPKDEPKGGTLVDDSPIGEKPLVSGGLETGMEPPAPGDTDGATSAKDLDSETGDLMQTGAENQSAAAVPLDVWALPEISDFPAFLTLQNNTASRLSVKAVNLGIPAYGSGTAVFTDDQYASLKRSFTGQAVLDKWDNLKGLQVKHDSED